MCEDERSLSAEFGEAVKEAKSLLVAEAMKSSVSGKDADGVVNSAKALWLLNRLLDLCCDMFEKHDKMTDKMMEVMDKYLNENKKTDKIIEAIDKYLNKDN